MNWIDNANHLLLQFGIVGLGITLIGFVVAVLFGCFDQPERRKQSLSTDNTSLSLFEKRQNAIHEASHALLFAICGDFPPGLSFSCQTPRDKGLVLVRGDYPFLSGTLENCEFNMLLLLAGQCAERCLHAEQAGNTSLLVAYWENRATAYLQCFKKYGYFAAPRNGQETIFNIETLQQLRKEQEKILEQFFQVNEDLLQALSCELFSKRMDESALRPYFIQVRATPEMKKFYSIRYTKEQNDKGKNDDRKNSPKIDYAQKNRSNLQASLDLQRN